MKKIVIFSVIVLFISLGCGFSKRQGIVRPGGDERIIFGKIVMESRLQQGGNLLIVPFKAGTGVEASDELDKAALMIVKGITEKLKEDETLLKIVSAEHAETADLEIKGHITQFERPRGMKKWLPKQDSLRLSLEGQLIDLKNGGPVALFSHHAILKLKQDENKAAIYQIGSGIGRFIQEHVKR